MSEMEITNPAAKEAPGVEIKVFKHHVATRIMHCCVAVGFLTCAISGVLLFAGVQIPRGTVALLHCFAGLLFFGAPLIYTIVRFRYFARFSDTVTHYNKDDLGWVTAPMGGYLDPILNLFRNPKHESYVPPQDKYNAGQKGAGICLMLGGVVLAITGFLMWANAGNGIFGVIAIELSPGVTWIIWTLHFIACVCMILVFLVHFVLSAVHPVTRVEFFTMFGNGIANYVYTKKKHGKWLNTLEVKEEHIIPDEEDK